MNNSRLNILVIGATGRTGQEILAEFHTKKTKNKIFGTYRNQKKKNLIEQYGATPILANLEDDLTDIAKGMDIVIYVAGTTNKDPDSSIPLVTYLALTYSNV
jgi:dihydrodipicolinate reductase